MILYRLSGFFILMLLAGCANFNSIYRSLDIGGFDRNSPRGVAIDVKQRAIFSTTRVWDANTDKWITRNLICPESSPDALSATSMGASISNILSVMTAPGGPLTTDQLQAAVAVGEAAASIGLRTQSIQLMRDGMVFNCLMFMNGALTEKQAYKLQRRNQNSTLGLLAIEQLTGAVKADQVALSSSSQSGSGKENVDKEAAAIEAAKAKQISVQSEADRKKLEMMNLETEVKAQQKKADVARATYETAVKAKSDEVASMLSTLQAEETALVQKLNDLQEKKIAAKALDEAVKSAVQQVKIAQEALDQANSRVRAATSADAFVNAVGGRPVLITENLAKSVENIIQTVLDESGKGEMCDGIVELLIYTLSSGYKGSKQAREDQVDIITRTLKELSCYVEMTVQK